MANNKNTGKLFKELKEITVKDFIKVFYGRHKDPYIISVETFQDGLGLTDLNERLENLENNVYKVTYYEIIDISTSTTGSITIPDEASVVTTGFDGNAVLSTLNGNDYPAGETPTQGGTAITANMDTSGNWVTSGLYTGGNVALIYQLSIRSEVVSNLDINKVIDFYIQGVDKTFTFEQAVPDTEWIINHNLNKFPSITVEDSSGKVVEGAEEYIDQNNLKINFCAAFSGKAHLN